MAIPVENRTNHSGKLQNFSIKVNIPIMVVIAPSSSKLFNIFICKNSFLQINVLKQLLIHLSEIEKVSNMKVRGSNDKIHVNMQSSTWFCND